MKTTMKYRWTQSLESSKLKTIVLVVIMSLTGIQFTQANAALDDNPKPTMTKALNAGGSHSSAMDHSTSAASLLTIDPATAFTTVWRTTTANESITIQTHVFYAFDYMVDWGDGSPVTTETGPATHVYATPGDHTVLISGTYPAILMYESSDAHKIIDVAQWGTNPWSSMDYAFADCINLNVSATDSPDLSSVTEMEAMFSDCPSLVGTTSFNNWDVSNVTSMTWTFENCSSFNQDLSNWNMSNVNYLVRIFQGASSFDQNVGDWDISSASHMTDMFEDAGLSTANYDSTLIGWSRLDAGETQIPTGLNFDGGNSKYCAGAAARQSLIDTYNWSISDGGQQVNCVDPATAFTTVWRTTEASESITIPTSSGETYNYLVNWGDGTPNTIETGNATHTYANPGDYTVMITGTFPRVFFAIVSYENSIKVRRLTQWGSNPWTSMNGAFEDCRNMQVTATDSPDLSGVTDMSYMFRYCYDLVADASIASWDVSNVTNMNKLFHECQNFNQDLSLWDVSNVTIMSDMFGNCDIYNQDISSWDVSQVTDLSGMFYGTDVFNQDISGWNVSNVTNMSGMFAGAEAFNQNIGSWNVSNVVSIGGMFSYATSFNQNIGNWNVSNVTNMNSMFQEATAFDQNIGSWDISSLTMAGSLLNGVTLSTANYDSLLIGWSTLDAGETQIPTGLTFSAGNSQYCTGAATRQSLVDTYNWTISDGGLEDPTCLLTDDHFVTVWKTDNTGISNSTSITIPTRADETYNYDVDWNNDGVFDDLGVTGNITHDFGTAGTYTIRIRGVFAGVYTQGANDRLKILDVKQWGTPVWTSGENAFAGCNLMTVTATDTPNFSQVTDMLGMFGYCSSLVGNESFNTWDVSSVTEMFAMFSNANSFDTDLSNWDVSNVSGMASMFEGVMLSTANYDSLLIGWSTLDAGETQIPTGLTFSGGNSKYCAGAVARQSLIDTYNWTITDGGADPLCVDPSTAFTTVWRTTGASESITIPTSAGETYNYLVNWGDGTPNTIETGNATHTYANPGDHTVMISGTFPRVYFQAAFFENCLKVRGLTQWGSNPWTTMEGAFVNCRNMQITATDSPDLSGVTNMSSMFGFCSYLEADASIASWDVSNVTDMSDLFHECSNFNQDLSLWDVSQVTNMSEMFGNCDNFNQDISSWDVSQVTDLSSMFISTEAFNQDISGWDVSNVTNMSSMFGGATAFNQDIGSWNVSNVVSMREMFSYTTSFNQNIGNWNVSNVTTMNSMFYQATAFDQNIGNWNVVNVNSMLGMFGGATSFNQNISNWNVANVTSMSYMFSDATAFNQNIDGWNVGNVTEMSSMFQGATAFNQDIGNWNVASVNSMHSMFKGATAFDQNIGSWDISSAIEQVDFFTPRGVKDMFTDAGLSTAHYDSLLIGWSTLDAGETQVPTGLTFSAGNSQYCSGTSARQDLIDTYNWTITDGGVGCDSDADADGIADSADNCPNTPNADQADLDNDGTGDVCDDDIDGDGVANAVDCAPMDAALFLGATCDDGDANTVDDLILADCSCAGTLTCLTDLNVDGTTNGEDFSIFLGNFGLDCPSTGPCDTDFNFDGTTNGEDFSIFLGNFGLDCPGTRNADQTDTNNDVVGGTREMESCSADINGDGQVDINDFLELNYAFGNTCSFCPEDINGDGQVDINDVLVFNSALGSTCGGSIATLEEGSEKLEVKIYPNPNIGQMLMIDLSRVSDSQAMAHVEVLDMTGRLVFMQQLEVAQSKENMRILFDDKLKTGVYIINIQVDSMIDSKRLIVE